MHGSLILQILQSEISETIQKLSEVELIMQEHVNFITAESQLPAPDKSIVKASPPSTHSSLRSLPPEFSV